MASFLLPTAHSRELLFHALETTEIALLIRQDLKGVDLKNCVLVCKAWWRLLAPYLWENIHIDYNPRYSTLDHCHDENKVVFRNGLAARSLTLSIYHPTDIDGTIAFVAKSCKNVSRLHLKLFSPQLTTNMCPTQKSTLPDESKMLCESDKNVPVLDMLLSVLPNVSDLTLSIADPDLGPQVIWCAAWLSNRLYSLSLIGGLKCSSYMIHKNSFCDWDLIMDVVRGLPRLNKLSVHWKNTSSIPGGSWRSAIQPQVEPDLTNLSLENTSIPNELQNHSLKRLEISYTQFVNETLLDVIYKTCPNIRYFQLASAKSRSPTTINNAIHRLLQSCRDLKSLQYFGSTSEYYGSTTTNLNSRIFQDSSRTWILLSELTLSLVNLEDPAEIELLGGNAPFSLSKLDIRGIGNTQQLNAVLKSFSTLTHLSVAGKFDGHAWTHLWHNDEARFYWTCQISAFASGQTLQHLDISELLIESHVLHERLFDKIQELPQLTCLLIDYDHLVKADLELTWPYRCDEEEMKHGAALPKWYQQNSESHSRLGARFPYPFWTQSQLVSAFEKKSREAHLQLRLQQLRQGNYFDFDFDYTFDIDGMREDELAENTRQHRHDYNYELSVQPLDGDAIGTNVSSSTSLSAEAQAERTNFFERTFRMFSQLQTLHVHEQSPTNCRDSILGNRFLSLHMVHAIAGMAPKLQRVSYHQSLKLDISRARKAYPHMDFYPVCN